MQSEQTQADPVPPGPATPPRTRWFRRRWVRRLSVGLVLLLVVLGVIGNLVLTRFVKDGVVRVLRCVTRNDAINPAVSLGGPPILLDLADRKLDRVTISGLSPAVMDQWLTSGSPGSSLAGPGQGDLTITLKDLGVSDPPSVQSAEAQVQLPWSGLSTTLAASSVATDTLAGATLGAEDGLLALTLRREVGGQPLKVLAGLKPDGGGMTVTPESIVVGGRKIGVGLVSLFAGDLLKDKNGESELKPRTIDLGLPDGVTVQALKVQADGLLVDLDIDPALIREQGRTGQDCLA